MIRHVLLCALSLPMSALADEACQFALGNEAELQPAIRTSPADPWLGVKGDQPADGLASREQVAAAQKRDLDSVSLRDTNIYARDDDGTCDAAHDHCLRDCTWFTLYLHYDGQTQNPKDAQGLVVPGHFRDRVFYPPPHLTARWNVEDEYVAYRTVPAARRLLKPGVRVIVPSQMTWDYAPNELTEEKQMFTPWVLGTVREADWEKNTLTLQGSAASLTLTYARVVVLTYKKDGKVELASGFTREQISLKPGEAKPAEAPPGALLGREVKHVGAESGAPVITKMRPTWCANVDVSGRSATWLGGMLKGDYPLSQVEKAVVAMCVAPDDAAFQEQVGAYYQAWANETGQSAEQLTEFFALNADQAKWQRQHEETCAKVAVAEEAPPRELSLGGMRKAILGCGYGSQTAAPRHLEANATYITDEDLYHFDRGAEVPSQVAAIFRVLTCVGLDEPDAPFTLARFAGCAADLRQLDEKRLTDELKRAGLNDYARVTALQAMSVARRRAAAVDAKLTALAKKDPDVQAALLDAPRRAWKDWESQASANQAALDAAWAAEDVAPAKGCLAAAQAALDGYLKRAGGGTTDALLTSATSPVGAVLLERLRACTVAEGRPEAASMLGTVIQWGFPRRGPRFYAGLAMTDAVVKAKERRATFPIPPDASRFPSGAPVIIGERNVDLGAQYSGTVAKVTPKGARVFVTFKTEKHLDDERECHETKHIVMFRPDGSPLYETICKLTGRKVESSSTATPFWVWAPQAAGISVGSFVRYNGGTTEVDRVFNGVPVEVTAAGSKKLLAAMGLQAR